MKVYLIGGLAADERVFRHIRFPEQYQTQFLSWLTPGKNESLESYAWRMSEQMDTREKFVIMGVSFGGLLATEISRKYPSEKTILIASVQHYSHMPAYFRWMQKAGLPKVFPIEMIKKSVMFNRLFKAESNEDKDIIRSMVRDADPSFIRWALTAALEWKGSTEGLNCFHIHGTKDLVFPIRFTKPSHIVEMGGHLMLMDRAKDINSILDELLR